MSALIMHQLLQNCSSSLCFPNRRNRAFSLTEVMFAIIILGIGFILVAAIFPVSISQSRLTVEETMGTGIARSALAQTSILVEGSDRLINAPLLPVTDMFISPPSSSPLDVSGGFLWTLPPGQQFTVRGKVVSFSDVRIDDASSGSINF